MLRSVFTAVSLFNEMHLAGSEIPHKSDVMVRTQELIYLYYVNHSSGSPRALEIVTGNELRRFSYPFIQRQKRMFIIFTAVQIELKRWKNPSGLSLFVNGQHPCHNWN